MKIALYVPSWPPGKVANGIVTYASHLVPALRLLGHEVFILTHASSDANDQTIELKRFSPKQGFWYRAMLKVAPNSTHFNRMSSVIARAVSELVTKHKIDVLEIEESFGWSIAASRLNLIPVIVRLHGPHFLMGRFDNRNDRNKANNYKQQQEGRSIRSAHYVTANCLDTLRAVEQHYGLTLTRSRVIPNPIDAVPDKDIWRLETCDTDSLLFVGRFDKVKGGDLVLRSFGRLAASFPRLRLTFVGPDRGIAAAEGKKLSFQEFVRENLPETVRSRIDFRGQISHAEVMSLRTKHFITIIAAQYDTMGYMMMEAMSLGCPMVATAVGGIPEFIKDQRNGLLIPSQDVDGMTAACRTLLENKALAEKIGRQAWLDCRKLYDSNNVAKQMISAYEDAIETFNCTRR
jgi:glycosyltransferase involved in cell wall biosynthesis